MSYNVAKDLETFADEFCTQTDIRIEDIEMVNVVVADIAWP
jgi:hypothetical protein